MSKEIIKLPTEQINQIIFNVGKTFNYINTLYMTDSNKWYVLEKYHRWLESSAIVDWLYRDMPEGWIELSRLFAARKYTAMREIIEAIDDLYTDRENHLSSYYNILNTLFGEGVWNIKKAKS